MAQDSLRIVETDEAGHKTATYIHSSSGQDRLSRVDVICPKNTKSSWQRLLDVFLPAGYPHSVTEDYLEYQIYDSLQAFTSSIASLLSSRAVLSSVGVGDSTASPTAALLLSILQESAGRIATILFAHRFGTALEPECKMYRLLADVLNDIAFVLDCLSPIFPKPVRVAVLSASSVLRSLCGVAAGSAKASLSAHFAKWGNLGELNAKDSSQETVISLLGMLVGSAVVSWVVTPVATWTALVLLLSIHLETNRRAVRAVCMRSMNRQRATLVYHRIKNGRVPTPVEIAGVEKIFESDGVLRDASGNALGYCRIGVPLSELLSMLAVQSSKATKSIRTRKEILSGILDLFSKSKYLLWYTKGLGALRVNIVLKAGYSKTDVICAWWQALAVAEELTLSRHAVGEKKSSVEDESLEVLGKTRLQALSLLEKHRDALVKASWDLETGAMETGSSVTIDVDRGS